MSEANDHSTKTREQGVLRLLADLKSGEVNASQLTIPERRQCVAHLHFEGIGVPQTAEILNVCERTVRRDRGAIAEENAIQPNS
ncbi:MAG: helix-turn-helix domain-containing protein [Phycisphaera sp.]|nr:MAG: helix-turn-helix domain-containing protein [Phycisphaera sp.]